MQPLEVTRQSAWKMKAGLKTQEVGLLSSSTAPLRDAVVFHAQVAMRAAPLDKINVLLHAGAAGFY